MKTILSILLALFIGQLVQAGTVSGRVFYQGDSTRPINGVTVTLRDQSNTLVGLYITGPDGYYEFVDIPTGTYQILGTKLAPGNGVTMIDAVMVLLNVMGIYPFNEIQTLAADVTGNGVIQLSDYNLIKQHVLRNAQFPVGNWVFLNETLNVTNLKDSHPGGLTGSSAGDVGGIFVPGTRGLEAYPIAKAGKVSVSPMESFTVNLKVKEALTLKATGLIINFPSDIISVSDVEFGGQGFEYVVDGNQIRLIWADETGETLNLNDGNNLVTIHCTANANFTAGMEGSFTLEGSSSLVGESYTEIKDAKLETPTIEYALPSLRLSNSPNPFAANTKLAYFLPKSGDVTIGIYDLSGKLVKEIILGEMAEGYHTYTLEGSVLTPGNYFCRINLAGVNTETLRIVKSN